MKFQATVYFAFFFIIFSCNSSSNRQLKNADTSKSAKTNKQSVDYVMLKPDIIDTAVYKTLPYWDSTLNQYSDAYIDTFSIGSNKFRFVNPMASQMTGDNSIRLQQRINNQWRVTNLTLTDNIHGSSYDHSNDINGDGYNDITNFLRFTQEVYFFNPKTNSFFDSALAEINPDWTLLDKPNNIYCDFQELKGMKRQISSSLYTFRNFKRYELYHLELYNSDNNEIANLITKLILSKCVLGLPDSLKKVQVMNLRKPIDTDAYDDHGIYADGSDRYFDYVKYWRERYKKLLGYR